MSVEHKIDDLRAVSDHVLTAAEQMEKLEDEKRTLEPGSPRFLELARRIESLATGLLAASTAEADIAAEVAGVPNLPTIDEAETTRGV